MSRILSREGATPRVSGFFFKSVIKVVLLFGRETSERKDLVEDNGRDVEIHLSSGSKGGGGVLDDGGICQGTPENGHTVYRYAITVRPVLGVGEGSWGAIWGEVVGTGRN